MYVYIYIHILYNIYIYECTIYVCTVLYMGKHRLITCGLDFDIATILE